ncbi:transposase, partial [Bacilli bacterium PM5-9]|nr:transposase [Bacilli bacterium PM5-9]
SKIKKLKTISCGYKKFERFKTRIFITENLIKI